MRILNGFGWFWGLGGAGGGETPFNAKNEEGSADSSKIEGAPQKGGHFWVMFRTPDVADTNGVYDALSGPQRVSKFDGVGVLPSVFRTF